MNLYLLSLVMGKISSAGVTKLILITSLMTLVISACGSAAMSTPKPTAASSNPNAAPASTEVANSNPIPFFAYYYIWFDVTSWGRAKKDYPLLGRYSSDDAQIMRQHIQWAK